MFIVSFIYIVENNSSFFFYFQFSQLFLFFFIWLYLFLQKISKSLNFEDEFFWTKNFQIWPNKIDLFF